MITTAAASGGNRHGGSPAGRIARGVLTGLVLSFGTLAAPIGAPEGALQRIDGEYRFTEGPAADALGNVCFTDVRASRIYKWFADTDTVELYREDTGNANGLYTAPNGDLIVCQGGRGRVVAIGDRGQVDVVADTYGGSRFNRPNDLWVTPADGIYFSDPLYGRGPLRQDGEHVYYVSPERDRVVRVIDDMVRPNGLIGTPDGLTVYVTDHGAGKTYVYAVEPDGTLSGKTLFAEVGGDGMTLDERGNVYLAADAVLVFDPSGTRIDRIEVPERPTNLTFAGPDGRILFITARSRAYTMPMAVRGAYPPKADREPEP